MSSSSRPHPQNTVSYHKYLLQATIQGRPVLSSCQPTVFGVHPGTFRDSATTCQKRHKDTEGAENMRKGIQKLMTSFVRPYAVTQLLTAPTYVLSNVYGTHQYTAVRIRKVLERKSVIQIPHRLHLPCNYVRSFFIEHHQFVITYTNLEQFSFPLR